MNHPTGHSFRLHRLVLAFFTSGKIIRLLFFVKHNLKINCGNPRFAIAFHFPGDILITFIPEQSHSCYPIRKLSHRPENRPIRRPNANPSSPSATSAATRSQNPSSPRWNPPPPPKTSTACNSTGTCPASRNPACSPTTNDSSFLRANASRWWTAARTTAMRNSNGEGFAGASSGVWTAQRGKPPRARCSGNVTSNPHC